MNDDFAKAHLHDKLRADILGETIDGSVGVNPESA